MKKQKEVIQVKEHQREIKKNRKEEKMTKLELLSKVTGIEVEVLENRNNCKDFQKYYKGKCQALTKTGKQCSREAVGSKYCWQHLTEEKLP